MYGICTYLCMIIYMETHVYIWVQSWGMSKHLCTHLETKGNNRGPPLSFSILFMKEGSLSWNQSFQIPTTQASQLTCPGISSPWHPCVEITSHSICLTFTWVLCIQNPFLTFISNAFYPPNHLPSPALESYKIGDTILKKLKLKHIEIW